MDLTRQLAKHFREVFFGGNWTSVNLKDSLADVDWQQATTKLYSLNTIAALAFHINYYIRVVLEVLRGKPLNGSDQYSFDLSPIQSQEDWEELMDKIFTDAENFAVLLEQIQEDKLSEDFSDGKYGSYYRNIQGIIEHTHYHLGQIVLIKKMIQQADVKSI